MSSDRTAQTTDSIGDDHRSLVELARRRDDERSFSADMRAAVARLAVLGHQASLDGVRYAELVIERVEAEVLRLGKPPAELAARLDYFASVGFLAADADNASPYARRAISSAMFDIAHVALGEPAIFLGTNIYGPYHEGLHGHPPRPFDAGVMTDIKPDALRGRVRLQYAFNRRALDEEGQEKEESGHKTKDVARDLVTAVMHDRAGVNYYRTSVDIVSGRGAIAEWVREVWDISDDLIARVSVVHTLRRVGVQLIECLPAIEAQNLAEEIGDRIKQISSSEQPLVNSKREWVKFLSEARRYVSFGVE